MLAAIVAAHGVGRAKDRLARLVSLGRRRGRDPACVITVPLQHTRIASFSQRIGMYGFLRKWQHAQYDVQSVFAVDIAVQHLHLIEQLFARIRT